MNVTQNKKWLSDQILSVSDNYYMKNHFYNLLYLICINRFIWTNLPNNIDGDFVEKELINNGELAFINHKDFGFIVTFCCGDYINIYGRPTKYLCWTQNNEVSEWYDADSEDIVIIRNNKLSQNSHDFIDRYASILGSIQKTKEVNLNALKTPILLTCDESQKLTLKNFYEQYEGNAPIIYGTKALDLSGVNVFKTDAPYLLDKLQEEKRDNFNECLTFLGINTTPEKKERLITDEVNANNDMVSICLSIFLNSRKQAIDEINRKFGLNIKLDLAEYCKRDFEKVPENNIEVGEING